MITTSAIPGARFVDPVVLARIGNLELLAKTVVDGFINGLHRSPYFGASVDFAEHRGYMPGDDIRRVDWKLFGRTDRFYIKEYEADTNANFSVLLDVSKSMGFGSRGITKLEYGKILAGCLTYMVHRQRDRVGFAAFDEDLVEFVPSSAKHMDVTLHVLDRLKPMRGGKLAPPLKKLAEHYSRKGMLVLVSDLYEDPQAIFDAVAPLRAAAARAGSRGVSIAGRAQGRPPTRRAVSSAPRRKKLRRSGHPGVAPKSRRVAGLAASRSCTARRSRARGSTDPTRRKSPGVPAQSVVAGKTEANVRTCSFRSDSVVPNGVHCIITPPSVRWALPCS